MGNERSVVWYLGQLSTSSRVALIDILACTPIRSSMTRSQCKTASSHEKFEEHVATFPSAFVFSFFSFIQ